MSGKGKASGVDNTARRVWDREEFSDKAKERQDQHDTQLATASDNPALDARKRKRLERDPLHQGIIVQRATLRARDQQLDLASNLNRTQMVSAGAPLSAQGGFYCEVCDAVLKDSHAWLDHLNGKWHNRALGMGMRVEKSTLEQVKARIQKKKGNRTTTDDDDGGGNSGDDDDNREERNRRLLLTHIPDGVTREDIEREEEKARREEEEEDDDDEDDDDGGMDPAMAAMMGFSGFAAGK